MPDTHTPRTTVNGIDLAALGEAVEGIVADPAKGAVGFRVATRWKGQTLSETTIDSYTMGGEKIDRHFKLVVDEPFELLGQNTAPNPQEYLMTAMNACIMVGYVAGASVKGITLDSVEIETRGELDLRGFLGLDPTVKPGYDKLHYTVRIKGDGTAEQFREIHENVLKTSPNYFNVTRPIPVEATLEVVA
jgi:uncharacterized OsmC-like protein